MGIIFIRVNQQEKRIGFPQMFAEKVADDRRWVLKFRVIQLEIG
ncbi:hypothetical protein OU792_13705 [Algoriphagus sp. NF]|nr:hypothetical protein [Algoriphagus sp. NF]